MWEGCRDKMENNKCWQEVVDAGRGRGGGVVDERGEEDETGDRRGKR